MLVGQLEPSITKAWDDGQQQAATELIRLANGCQQNQAAIVAAGAFPVLAAWLQTDHLWAQKQALLLLVLLLDKSQSNHMLSLRQEPCLRLYPYWSQQILGFIL